MIDGRKSGPYTLDELQEAGVTPETYVWCKGMDDWEKAADVADICRYYRQRLFNLMHPGPQQPQPGTQPQQMAAQQPQQPDSLPLYFRSIKMAADQPADTSLPPAPMLFISLLLTFFCFPFTGLVAVYYSWRPRKSWAEARRSLMKGSSDLYSDKEREKLRAEAHDYARQAKMWAGITFFLGIIVYAFFGKTLL